MNAVKVAWASGRQAALGCSLALVLTACASVPVNPGLTTATAFKPGSHLVLVDVHELGLRQCHPAPHIDPPSAPIVTPL